MKSYEILNLPLSYSKGTENGTHFRDLELILEPVFVFITLKLCPKSHTLAQIVWVILKIPRRRRSAFQLLDNALIPQQTKKINIRSFTSIAEEGAGLPGADTVTNFQDLSTSGYVVFSISLN